MNQKKKIKGSTYLAAAHLAEDQAGPTPSLQPSQLTPSVVFNLESTSSSVENWQAPDPAPLPRWTR
jgi:hypothetical protein